MSRVVDGQYIFGDAEKELFRALMRELAEFCQVRILTFCLMSNHFHILVDVPRPPDPLPSAEETLEALSRLTGCQDVGAARQQLQAIRARGDAEAETRWLAGYHARRWNLSAFMQILKQRFSALYNRRHGRRGTLWEERFKSVIVEGEGRALVTMAAYIDLNPVRAGLVKDPLKYRWCGYTEAVAGKSEARAGVLRIVRALMRQQEAGELEALEIYRQHLFVEGNEERESIAQDGHKERGSIAREAVLKVLAEKGRLPTAEYLKCRVRYFCDGAVFGSREFVESIFQSSRERFGVKRKTGARALRGMQEGGLFAARALRLNVFG
jgi:REP element-mobilizing transposase RayT